ncbi:MAG: DegT/DnrJ/EryC1/StrS aminotransferase family protein [Minisyncoccus archaeiphilus]|uniref:DegT/DnrJ/EryC1/StrS family aminotransferase n=1 Tax=Minisyncoccus archaeiphilus TaxID=3238481 RepID=UPI002B15E39A|nr:MAG: DegT/DnrJ/EryC1/StrS aminotransferase family protein [Candidatus Parcubacteria bacterium]
MIKLIKSSFYNEGETKKRLADFILNTEILSMNEQCARFESSFAEKQGRKYAIFVSNGSAANLLLIQSLLNLGRIKKGDNVGFSSLTWATNVMPLIQLGLNPVPLDCSIETLNISPAEVEKSIGRIKALFLTNVLGFCDNIANIKDICEKNNILLIEDNCEALGSKFGGELLGNFGAASTFSFFIGHHLSTIEGGMICTDDEELRDMLVMARAHGWDRNLSSEKQKKIRDSHGVDDFYAKYTFYDLAFNVRPCEINGFLGNIQIDYWDEIVNKRQDNFRAFHEAVNTNSDFFSLEVSHMGLVSNFAMPVICKDVSLLGVYLKRFMEAGVEIRPVIAGNILEQPFFKKYINSVVNCHNSNLIHRQGFYFGNNPEMTSEEIGLLCNLLKK